jgi:hypothetical protein
MIIENYGPHSLDWNSYPSERTAGETGFMIVKTQTVGYIRIRLIEYSSGYIPDHWCDKGHIIHVISGELMIEYNNSIHILQSGMTHIIGDNTNAHKAKTFIGATVLIVD